MQIQIRYKVEFSVSANPMSTFILLYKSVNKTDQLLSGKIHSALNL